MTGLLAGGGLTLSCARIDARPLFWTEDDETRNGYEPRAAELAAAKLGLEVRWEFRRWDSMGAAVLDGEADAQWCGVAITPERRRKFRFSIPYIGVRDGLLVRADSPITSPADCAGRRIGAIAASTNMSFVESLPGTVPVTFDGTSPDVFQEMITATDEGGIDGFVDDELALIHLAETGAFRVALTGRTEHVWGAAVRPGNDEVVDLLDRGLAEAISDGSLADEWRRWFPRVELPSVLDPSRPQAG